MASHLKEEPCADEKQALDVAEAEVAVAREHVKAMCSAYQEALRLLDIAVVKRNGLLRTRRAGAVSARQTPQSTNAETTSPSERSMWTSIALPIFVGPSTSPGQLCEPCDVCFNKALQLWCVADYGNSRLAIFNHDFVLVRQIDDAGDGAKLAFPVCCGTDQQENTVLTVDSTHRVFVYDLASGRLLRTFGPCIEGLEAPLNTPHGVCVDPLTSNIILSDFGNHRICIVRRDGSLVGTLGCRGTGNGQFAFPTHCAVLQDTLWVCDYSNDRIQKFARRYSVASDVPWEFVLEHGTFGAGPENFHWPERVCVTAMDQVVLICDKDNHRVIVARADNLRFVCQIGSSGSGLGEFNQAWGAAIDDEHGLLAVADAYNHRLQVFSLRK